MSNQSVVYLIHLQEPLSGRMRHYIGTAADLAARVKEHRRTTWTRFPAPITLSDGRRKLGEVSGPGALVLGVANACGIDWNVVRVWKGGRKLERHLKNQRHSWRHCPICNTRMKKKVKPYELEESLAKGEECTQA